MDRTHEYVDQELEQVGDEPSDDDEVEHEGAVESITQPALAWWLRLCGGRERSGGGV